MGTKAGFPDLFIFIPKGGYHGLFIELKNQEMMINRLNAVGYKVVVAYGAIEAIDEIKAYLGIGR